MDAGLYVSGLINQPWARDGRHCWRVVVDVQRDLFGRIVPPLLGIVPVAAERSRLFTEHKEWARWCEYSEPHHGAIALMHAWGTSPDDLIHAGVYLALDGGGVLHCDFPQGVAFDSLRELTELRRRVPRWFMPRDAS